MTGGLWRLMTGSCQSSSHRESRALPSAPKLMGRRQGGEVTRPREAGWRQRERGKNGGLSVKDRRTEVDGAKQGGNQGQGRSPNEMEG